MRLQDYGPTMVSELAHSLAISIPSASSIVDRMEEHGLVERMRNEIDRRVVHVAITDRGRTVAEEFHGPKQTMLQGLLARMTDEELKHVALAVEAVLRVQGSPDHAEPTDMATAS
jgi:DNA-binding MarR family transcriptional regulator